MTYSSSDFYSDVLNVLVELGVLSESAVESDDNNAEEVGAIVVHTIRRLVASAGAARHPFKSKLFVLLDIATETVIDGYEIELIQDWGDSRRRCEADDDHDWYFNDQGVVVNSDGVGTAETAPDGADDDPRRVQIELRMSRPVIESDLSQ